MKTEKSWYDDNPAALTFSIGTAAELAYMAQLANNGNGFSGRTINITNDIDLAELETDWISIGSFSGVFDGNGKTISNMTITGSGDNLGLFGSLSTSATIRNVKLVNANIPNGGSSVGGLVGGNRGLIENCFVSGNISGLLYVGGIAGFNQDGTIRNCHSAANVNISGTFTNPGAGGIVGFNSRFVEYSYTTGVISGIENSYYIGGVVGWNRFNGGHQGIMTSCVALNSSISIAGTIGIGRVAGNNLSGGGIMVNCHARADMPVYAGGYTADKGPDRKDGADVSAAQFNTQAWWAGIGFDFSSSGPWMWNTGTNLPVLK
jgi:hypothetical protein